MPGSCWGRYAKVAVMQVEPGVTPTMISRRAKGVLRVVRVWDKLNIGRASGNRTFRSGPSAGDTRSAFAKAYREAEELRDWMEKEHG